MKKVKNNGKIHCNKKGKEFMTRAEAELHSIRTTIEAYEMILKNNTELSEDDKNKIRKK